MKLWCCVISNCSSVGINSALILLAVRPLANLKRCPLCLGMFFLNPNWNSVYNIFVFISVYPFKVIFGVSQKTQIRLIYWNWRMVDLLRSNNCRVMHFFDIELFLEHRSLGEEEFLLRARNRIFRWPHIHSNKVTHTSFYLPCILDLAHLHSHPRLLFWVPVGSLRGSEELK